MCSVLIVSNRIPTLVGWSVTGALAFFFFAEPIPIARRDIHARLPLIGHLWKQKE
jgi:hypothetical protein